MMICFIILCVAVLVIDEARQKHIDLKKMAENNKEWQGMDALSSLIAILETPVAKRKGVTISPEDCEIWVEELRKIQIRTKR